jgi:uncharacterized membrane protein YbhN (UPF0104 family)
LTGKRIAHFLRILLVLAIVGAAVWFLTRQLRGFDTEKFLDSLHRIAWWQVALALVLVGVNYVFLFGYDYLALRYIKHPLPLGKLAVASFIGHASSFNLGSLFGGAAARYRLYSSWKLSSIEILQLIAILGVTFWMGVLALAGIVFLIDPFPIPQEMQDTLKNNFHVSLPAEDVRPLAYILLAIVAGYLLLCAVWRKPLRIQGREIPLPPPGLSLAQIGVACADLFVAAGVMYALFPPGADLPFLRFLGVFLLAWVVAALAHAPGAMAVLEAIIIGFLCQDGRVSMEQGAAVLLVFRVIYYLLPLALAGGLFLGHEVHLRRKLWRQSRAGATPRP